MPASDWIVLPFGSRCSDQSGDECRNRVATARGGYEPELHPERQPGRAPSLG